MPTEPYFVAATQRVAKDFQLTLHNQVDVPSSFTYLHRTLIY